MGLITRIVTVIKSKLNIAINAAEDPREILDYSYEQQVEMLRDVTNGIVQVTTAKRRLQNQKSRLKQSSETLERQARVAVKADRDDLARIALERKAGVDDQIEGLTSHIETIINEERKLIEAKDSLLLKIEIFRTKKETIKAQYSAAVAQANIQESITGIGGKLSDIGNAIERSENKIEEMKARSSAIGELVEGGTIGDFTGGGDTVSKELSKVLHSGRIESELSRLKEETVS